MRACVRNGAEKPRKELLAKRGGGVATLLAALEQSDDVELCESIASIFCSLASGSGKVATTLVARGATAGLLKALHLTSRGSGAKSEHLNALIFNTLADLAPKDKRFGILARLHGVIPLTVAVAKNNVGNSKMLLLSM